MINKVYRRDFEVSTGQMGGISWELKGVAEGERRKAKLVESWKSRVERSPWPDEWLKAKGEISWKLKELFANVNSLRENIIGALKKRLYRACDLEGMEWSNFILNSFRWSWMCWICGVGVIMKNVNLFPKKEMISVQVWNRRLHFQWQGWRIGVRISWWKTVFILHDHPYQLITRHYETQPPRLKIDSWTSVNWSFVRAASATCPKHAITRHHETQPSRLKIDNRTSALIIRRVSVRGLPELRG